MDNVSTSRLYVLPKAIGFPKLSKLLEKTTVLLKITEKKVSRRGKVMRTWQLKKNMMYHRSPSCNSKGPTGKSWWGLHCYYTMSRMLLKVLDLVDADKKDLSDQVWHGNVMSAFWLTDCLRHTLSFDQQWALQSDKWAFKTNQEPYSLIH